MIGIVGLADLTVCACSGAFDGEMAMAAVVGLVSRSWMICASPASSEVEAGPGVEALVLASRRSREFHFWQPWLIASKNGLSRPFTTITSCFLSWASAGPASARPVAAKSKVSPFIHFLP